MNKTATNYRSILTSELLQRVKNNPAYSLRRFAQQLELSPATLSGVLSGKRRLSLKSASKISDRLNLTPADAAKFYQSVASSLTENGARILSPSIPEYKALSEDVFRVISEWYYYAILELTYVSGCQDHPRWFAKKLGINYNQAADAIERLITVGLLDRKKGRLIKTNVHLASPSGISSSAVRQRHREILNKALESLETHSVNERDFTSMTMSIDPALLPEAKKRIAEFRRELCAFLESGKRKRVYEMSVQLFPLSEGDEK